ncbi:MAG: hypothetical protein OXH13_02880 [Chloroflexi bacterium]|nr:hypothetical protein [Chloroflexota bacterium]MCY3696968.1 hypothetical protein [Chloroflexota bacterium]
MATPASDIDLSPMVFTEFVSNSKRYRTDRPLVFTFEYVEEDGKGLFLFEGEYDIISGAYSREEAWDMIDDALAVYWRDFAEADPAGLDGVAVELGEELRRRFKLVTDAS